MLDVRRLQVLKEVAARGSFSAAARALYLTQPAVSRHVAKLEAEAGAQLVERTSRGLRLTEAGAALVARAEAISAQLVAAEAELRAVRELERGTVRVASFPSAAVTFVVDAMTALKRRHPGIELSFEESDPAATVAAVRAGDADVGVIFDAAAGAPAPLPGLERIHLLDDPTYAALPASHRLASRRAVSLADLAGDGWIVGLEPYGPIWRACVAAGFEPRVVARSDDSGVSQGLVAAGLAVSLVPGLARPRGRKDLALRPLRPRQVFRSVSAVVLDGPRQPAVAAFLELLRRKAPR